MILSIKLYPCVDVVRKFNVKFNTEDSFARVTPERVTWPEACIVLDFQWLKLASG